MYSNMHEWFNIFCSIKLNILLKRYPLQKQKYILKQFTKRQVVILIWKPEKILIVFHVPYHFEFLQRMKHSKQRQMQEHLGYIPSSFQPPYFALHPRFLAYLQLLRFPKIKNKTKHLFFTVIIYFHIIIIIIIIICFLLYQFWSILWL